MINYLKKIFYLVQNIRTKIFFIFILIFILSLLDLFGIYLFIPLISKLLDNNSLLDNLFLDNFLRGLDQNLILLIIFIIFFIKSIFHILFISMKSNLIRDLTFFLSRNLLKRYLIKKYEYFFNYSSSTLIRNINSEVPAFASRTILVMLNMINDLLLLVFLLSFLMYFSFDTTIASLVFFIVTISFFLYSTKKLSYRWGKIRLNSEKEKLKIIDQIFHGIREIKIFNLQKLFFSKFKDSSFVNLNVQAKDSILQQTPRIVLEAFSIGTLLFFLGFLLQSKTNSEVIMIMGIYVISFSRILPAFSRIVMSLNSLKFTMSTTELLYDEFIKKDSAHDLNQKENKISFSKEIKLSNISFSFNNAKKPILKNINLTIKNNTIYGITGQSGTGKSTLLDIITGLLTPTYGKIIVDEAETLKIFFLSNAAYVSQNTFLLNDTISKNISLKNINKKEEAHLLLILKKVNLYNFVQNLKNGIDTIIGEGGISLSGGEKQRLSLARALYQSPRILLLDEFTSALDVVNEKKILENLLILKKDMTVIIVSHSKKVLDICDKKYQLFQGELNEIN